MAKKIKIKTVTVPVGKPIRKPYRYGGNDYIEYEGMVTVNIDGYTLDEIIEKLLALKLEFGGEYTDLKIVEVEETYAYESGSYKYLRLYGTRPESDVERDLNTENEAKAVAAREERERAEFERLQKKFGEKK